MPQTLGSNRRRNEAAVEIFYHCRCTDCVFNPSLKYWFCGFQLKTCQRHIREKKAAFPEEDGDPWDLVSAGRRPYPDNEHHYPHGEEPINPVLLRSAAPDDPPAEHADDMDDDPLFQPDPVLVAVALPPLQPAAAAAPAAPAPAVVDPRIAASFAEAQEGERLQI